MTCTVVNTKDKTAQDDSGYGVLLEQIIHQNDTILENMGEMLDMVRRIPLITAKLVEHDEKFEIIIAAIKDLSRIGNGHETRIVKLERIVL